MVLPSHKVAGHLAGLPELERGEVQDFLADIFWRAIFEQAKKIHNLPLLGRVNGKQMMNFHVQSVRDGFENGLRVRLLPFLNPPDASV